jgi:hypothetical protein
MLEYDIIFFNCGISEDWLMYEDEIKTNIRNFVEQGGSVYASDWAHIFVEASFPSKIDFHGEDHDFQSARVGNEGFISATVLDSTMIEILGSETAEINFDLASWVIADNVDDDVETLLKANVEGYDWYDYNLIQIEDAPLAVRFEYGEGKLIFTSFHNEHQNTTFDMETLLKEIIFSL